MTPRTPRIIAISSGKGGVGKTTVSVNLAVALALKGARVLLVDGDLGLANVDVILGLNVRHSLQETIEEGRPPEEILVEVLPGFSVLPASSGVPEMAALSHEEQEYLTETLTGLTRRFDFVLVDTAAGIGEAVLWFNQWAEENIVVLSPDPTSLTDAYALMKVLSSRMGKTGFQLLVNNVKSMQEGKDVFRNMSSVARKFLRLVPDFLGALPHDAKVVAAIRSRRPFLLENPACRASHAIAAVAGRLLQATDGRAS